jgi:hypothetical protein
LTDAYNARREDSEGIGATVCGGGAFIEGINNDNDRSVRNFQDYLGPGREALIALVGVLVIVAFGHPLRKPYFNLTGHVIPRLALLLFLLRCPRELDRFSLDYLTRPKFEPIPPA